MTNNVAEYTALIKACEWLLQNKIRARTAIVRSDSQLLIRQLSKRYAVRSPRLLPLYNQVTALLRELRKQCEQVYFEWVPREKNKEADALSVKAYMQHRACRSRRGDTAPTG